MASLKLFWKHHVGIKASKKHLVCVLLSYLPGRIGMWISNFSKKSKFDWFLKSQIFAKFSLFFGPIRPGCVTLGYAQYFWSNVHVKESSKQGHIWAEDTFWCGPNSILKCQKSDIFTQYRVEIRPKRIEMLINSAQRFYIWKLHQKCYLTPTYVFLIALTVIILQRLEEMLKNPMIFNILRVNIKIRNGT